MDKNYTKHSLEKVQEWIRDSIDAEATPKEIYDAIVSAMTEDYDYHQRYAQKCKDLLDLLTGMKSHSSEYKWTAPIEMDGLSGECYVNLPDDLMELANLKETDNVEWVDNHNGSYSLRKLPQTLEPDEC